MALLEAPVFICHVRTKLIINLLLNCGAELWIGPMERQKVLHDSSKSIVDCVGW
jgi:hypothetical protein